MSSLQALRIRPPRALRDLASFKAKDGVVLSLYVGFDPSVTRTGDETATRIASLLEQATRAAEAEHLEHDARLAFSTDIERARDEVLSRLGPAGVACFADSTDGLWHVEERHGLPDLAKVQSSPYLVPLVAAAAEDYALVAVVGREQGEVFVLRGGRMEQLADLSEDQPRRHHAGHAWHQPSLERHSDELAHAHLRRVATKLDELLRRPGNTPLLVLAGEQKQAAALRVLLSDEASTALAGVIHPRAHATPADLEQLALPLLERRRQSAEDELVDLWQAMKADGTAVQGWPDTLASASDGRISLLLFRERGTRPAFVCDTCDRASAQAGTCPLHGQPLRPQPDGLDIAVRLTLRRGGEARAIRHRTDLDDAGAIGALLNF